MRLAQLARKLSLKPADIQVFLQERNQTVELNPNTRLTEEQVLQAVRHFDPSMEAAILQEPAAPEVAEPVSEIVVSVPVETPIEELELTEEPTEQSGAEMPFAEDTEPTSEAEVIRAPKLELPGLRVVGKIELKEARKKEAASASPEGAEPRTERPLRPANRERQQRQWKNPLEQQRQREAQEREEKRAREIEAAKQRRTQKYLNKVKSVPTKRVRRDEEAEVEVVEDARPAPKTWLGRFARWLTT